MTNDDTETVWRLHTCTVHENEPFTLSDGARIIAAHHVPAQYTQPAGWQLVYIRGDQ